MSHFFVVAGLISEKNSQNIFVPILSVWPGKSFETLAIIVIFRKKKEERKKKSAKKKRAKKKIPEWAFPLFTCKAVILLVF